MEIRQTFTMCDNCNLARMIDPSGKGVFAGTFKQAAKHGWTEEDFGHACPNCFLALLDSEDEEHGPKSSFKEVIAPQGCVPCEDTGWKNGLHCLEENEK